MNLYAYVKNPLTWIDPLGLAGCNITPSKNFGSPEKLTSHFEKHGGEFRAKTEAEYLNIGRDIIRDGHKVNYYYKPTDETRTGYVMFMGNTKKGEAKMAFVGMNPKGEIATIHTKSGKEIWKLLNGDAKNKTINVIARDINGL
ncbi:hypothetical protein [Serratia fonticola]|jgi:uncharacterized protein RhaS with RHS repeats|uniref:hypothetical protein n=1 Tax=Serratia fonticola TaxID=47917 RepID=UPI001FBA03CB|nr:hypothetical protein [Serratia fonticola]